MRPVIKGVFKEKLNELAEGFGASHQYDRKLYEYDILGSIAWAKMLKKIGVLNKKELDLIIFGLKKIGEDIKKGRMKFRNSLEDIHMHIESELVNKIGDTAKKLHTGRSRNEQVALDERMYCRDKTGEIIEYLKDLQKSLLEKAEENIDVIMPGYTHLQQAQPISAGHYFLSYIEKFERDKSRFYDTLKRIDVLVLGSSALAGSTLNIDRKFLAEELGFKNISKNSLDAVSDRDFVIEIVFNSAMTAMHLSRLSEDLIIYKTKEFDYIEIGESFCTGSSLMPQKINPDIAELIRGKTARFYGNLMQELVLMKSLPLAYNRDMQEDKLTLFDTVETLAESLQVMSAMIKTVKFKKEKIKAKMSSEMLATDIAEYLVKKGVPFRDAHGIVGEIVRYAKEHNKEIDKLTVDEFKKFSQNFDKDIAKLMNFYSSVNSRNVLGGTSIKNVKKEISRWKKRLN